MRVPPHLTSFVPFINALNADDVEEDTVEVAEVQGLELHPDHPKFGVHVARRRKLLAVPQLLRDPPARPPSTSDSTVEQQQYAAYRLSLLLPDWEC